VALRPCKVETLEKSSLNGRASKLGATVIDIGINRIGRDGKARLVGEVDFAEIGHANTITPAPGGVGPMTIGCLLANTLEVFRRAHVPSLSGILKKVS